MTGPAPLPSIRAPGSGIAEDMVAITAQGEVVGLVTAVGSNWATVTTVLDSALEVSANIAPPGYARYGAGRLHHWREECSGWTTCPQML